MPWVPDYRGGGGVGRKAPKGRSWPLGCLALLLTVVGCPVVGEVSGRVAYRIVERPVLSSLYGPGSYAKGLRVIGKHGELSDGRRLPEGWNIAIGIGAFVLMSPAVIAYLVLLKSFGLFPPDRPFKPDRSDAEYG